MDWDPGYKNILERENHYEEARDVYRRLKEWYRAAGMMDIAGEFHYREREADRKAQLKRFGTEFRQFKREMAGAWNQLKEGLRSIRSKEL